MSGETTSRWHSSGLYSGSTARNRFLRRHPETKRGQCVGAVGRVVVVESLLGVAFLEERALGLVHGHQFRDELLAGLPVFAVSVQALPEVVADLECVIRTAVGPFRIDRTTACGRTGKSLQQSV
jgi:hypothetical protein